MAAALLRVRIHCGLSSCYSLEAVVEVSRKQSDGEERGLASLSGQKVEQLALHSVGSRVWTAPAPQLYSMVAKAKGIPQLSGSFIARHLKGVTVHTDSSLSLPRSLLNPLQSDLHPHVSCQGTAAFHFAKFSAQF